MMSDMVSSRIPRLVRGGVAATFATFVALFAHVVSGGEMPALIGVLVPLLLSTTACTLLAGRRLSALRLTASVGIAQSLFHTLFVLGSGTSAHSAPSSHHTDPAVTASVLDAETSMHSHASGAGMWIGHGAAAIVTIAVLYFAERMLLALASTATRVDAWIRRIVEALTRPVPAVFALRDVVVLGGSRALRAGGCLGSVSRRGPPLLSV